MIQVMPVIGPGILIDDACQRVGGELDGSIADGVQTQLPAKRVGVTKDRVELLGRARQLATIVALILVGFDRVGRGARETAIDENFDRTEAQVFVSIAGFVTVLA